MITTIGYSPKIVDDDVPTESTIDKHTNRQTLLEFCGHLIVIRYHDSEIEWQNDHTLPFVRKDVSGNRTKDLFQLLLLLESNWNFLNCYPQHYY